MNPLISIIVPIYNVEPYLDQCIRTLVGQTLQDIEIILVDDGSPDACPAICDGWAKKDGRIKLVHKANAGLGYARNSGLDVANGEYVAFVDSDDYVDMTMFEKLYFAAHEGEYDAVFCGLKQFSETGVTKEICDFDEETVFNSDHLPELALSFLHETDLTRGKRMFMSVWHSIYKMETIRKRGLRFCSEREILSEDLPFQLEFILNSHKIKFIPDKLYYYRCNPGSLSMNFKESKFAAALRLRNMIRPIVENVPNGPYYVDFEFVDRLRGLAVQFVFSSQFTYREKRKLFDEISGWGSLRHIDLEMISKERSWKYMCPLYLLSSGRSALLISFIIFDRYVNKEKLFFWKH